VVLSALLVGALFGALLGAIPRRYVRSAIGLALLACGFLYVATFSKEPLSVGYLRDALLALPIAVPLVLLPAGLVAFGTHTATRSFLARVVNLRRHLKDK